MANSVSASNIFGKFAILSIVLGFYFTFLVEGFTGFRGLRNLLLLLGSLLFLAKVLIDGRLIIQKDYLIYSLLSLPILIFSLPLWHSLSEVNVYISLITSIIVISSDYTYFKKNIKNIILYIADPCSLRILYQNIHLCCAKGNTIRNNIPRPQTLWRFCRYF